MRNAEVISMMRSRRPTPEMSAEALAELCRRYPYCSSYQSLYAMAAKAEDLLDRRDQLQRAAIAIQDRSKLYDYVLRDELHHTLRRVTRETAADDRTAPEVSTDATSNDGVTVAGVGEETKRGGDPSPQPPERETEQGEGQDQAELPGVDQHRFPRRTEAEPDVSEAAEADDGPIASDPLEAEIMRAAVMHLGELEADRGLKEKESEEEPDNVGAYSNAEQAAEPPPSFGDWLLSLESEPEDKVVPRQSDLIEKFIEEDPQINPVKKAFFSPSQIGKMSLVEDETFVTETLAGIYYKQGDYSKAARAYKNLALKYPKKSVYFADLQKRAEQKIKK